jgi:hypothetical protein
MRNRLVMFTCADVCNTRLVRQGSCPARTAGTFGVARLIPPSRATSRHRPGEWPREPGSG